MCVRARRISQILSSGTRQQHMWLKNTEGIVVAPNGLFPVLPFGFGGVTGGRVTGMGMDLACKWKSIISLKLVCVGDTLWSFLAV